MEEALKYLSKFYGVTSNEIYNFLEKTFNNKCKKDDNKDINIILPYYGVIEKHKCKGLIFNHGLYTQCTEDINKNDFCCKCKNNKYGTVYDREKYEIGKYISPAGKKEVDYNKFIEKMGYDLNIVKKIFKEKNIEYNLDINNIKNTKRGRPKKIVNNNSNINNDNEEIEVETVTINGTIYFRTLCNMLLDIEYNIVGRVLKDGIVELL